MCSCIRMGMVISSKAVKGLCSPVGNLLLPGRVEYWYAEVATWHTTHPSGIEVFHFGSGQTEAHHPKPDSYKEVRVISAFLCPLGVLLCAIDPAPFRSLECRIC